ncbi:hypothetical protein DL95DRAFT_457028 [Leptodontidium sp. 2 PMI_412]|nr:hypothetical protein DL95DRAFT_457028 [Leptodontidium sp. 2 PMI_412]
MVTGKVRPGAGPYTYDQFSSSSSNSQHQMGRASRNRTEPLPDQYVTGSLPRPISPPVFSAIDSSQDKMCPPPGFDDSDSDDKLADLRAIVNFIVPAGGIDPHVYHGPFECLKYSPGDVDEDIEHFVRNGEAEYPEFSRAHLPPMVSADRICWRGVISAMKETRLRKRMRRSVNVRPETAEAGLNTLQQPALGRFQQHPAQLEDELAYQVEYGYAEFNNNDYNRGIDSGFKDDFCLTGNMKDCVSKKGSPKMLNGYGTIRRRSSSSSKAKKATKQRKLDRGSKQDGHRSCFDLFMVD